MYMNSKSAKCFNPHISNSIRNDLSAFVSATLPTVPFNLTVFLLSSVPATLLLLSALLLGRGKQSGICTEADGEQPTFPYFHPGKPPWGDENTRDEERLLPVHLRPYSSIPRRRKSSIKLACSIYVAVAFEEMPTHSRFQEEVLFCVQHFTHKWISVEMVHRRVQKGRLLHQKHHKNIPPAFVFEDGFVFVCLPASPSDVWKLSFNVIMKTEAPFAYI